MVAGRQPRWPDGTPVAPSGRGPGGGRWRDDGKPNKPRRSWAEVASEVIGRVRGKGGGGHDGNLDLDYPAQMKLRGATDEDLTAPTGGVAPRKAAPAKKAAPRKAAAPRAATPAGATTVTSGSRRLPGESQSDYDERMHREYPYAAIPGTTEYDTARQRIKDRVASPGAALSATPPRDWAAEVDHRVSGGGSRSKTSGRAAMSDQDLTDVLSSGPREDQAGANARAVDYLDQVHSDRLRALRDKLATERARGRGNIGDRSVIESLDHVVEQRGEVSGGGIARDRLAAVEQAIRAGKGKRTPIKKRVLDHLSDQQLTLAELEDMRHEIEKRNRRSGDPRSTAYDHRISEALLEALRLQGSPKYRQG